MLSRLENDVIGNAVGLGALDGALSRAADALLKRKNKRWLIIYLDSTEDPAHGNQEGVACNGHFARIVSIRSSASPVMAIVGGPG
jgi:hypothetical protein